MSKEDMGNNRLIQMSDGRFTKAEVVFTEHALIDNVKSILAYKKPLTEKQEQYGKNFLDKFIENHEKTNSYKLNEDQIETMNNICRKSPIAQFTGDAGTGKTTTTIKFAVDYTKHFGNKVFGLSVGDKATKALTEAGIEQASCINSSKFLSRAFVFNGDEITNQVNKKFLNENKNATIIFDEAGMCGAKQMKFITDFVKQAREIGGECKLVLVGDPKQLKPVEYGDSFLLIEKHLQQDDIGRLTENTRQKNPVAMSIADNYKDKKIDKVFRTLEENNLLITEKEQKDVSAALVKDYLNDSEKSKIIICGLNTEIDSINLEVRAGIAKQNKAKKEADPTFKPEIEFENSKVINVTRTSGSHKYDRERPFCKGEEIVFLEGYKNKNKNSLADNADVATIKDIKQLSKDNFKMTVELKGKEFSFETKDYNKFNHAYAVSTHKSQGATVSKTYHLGNASMANYNNCYVNGSRHKDEYRLYLKEDDVDKYKRNAIRESEKATTVNDINCQNAIKEALQFNARKELVSELQQKNKIEPLADFMIAKLDKSQQLDNAIIVSKQNLERSKTLEKDHANIKIPTAKELKTLDEILKTDYSKPVQEKKKSLGMGMGMGR